MTQKPNIKLDYIDIKILQILQKNADISVAQLAGAVGLSPTPCWNRIQRLNQHKLIKKKVALLDSAQIGIDVVVFVAIKANHNKQWLEDFQKIVAQFEEITEAFRMSGEIDYLLKVQVGNIKQFDNFYKKLVSKTSVDNVTSNIALEVIKSTTELSLENLRQIHKVDQ